jgi:predicted nucleic acid-binding protein
MKTRGSERVRAAHVVLDTSAYSRFREGHEAIATWLGAATSVAVPATVLGELEAGFLLGRRTAENQVALSEFLAEPFVRVLDVTANVARRYGAIFALLRRRSTPIGANDIWIAATAIEHAGHLVTFDDDYGKIPGLDVTILS